MTWKEIEALLPHIFIISLVVLALAFRVLKYLNHKQKTLLAIKLLNNSPNIDASVLKSILQPTPDGLTDLRRGLLLITLCLACLIFAENLMDTEYMYALRGLSAFPGLLGLLYILFHFFAKKLQKP